MFDRTFAIAFTSPVRACVKTRKYLCERKVVLDVHGTCVEEGSMKLYRTRPRERNCRVVFSGTVGNVERNASHKG